MTILGRKETRLTYVRKPSKAEIGKEMVRKVTRFVGEVIVGRKMRNEHRKPSKAENGKEMVRKVTNFDGEVMVV